MLQSYYLAFPVGREVTQPSSCGLQKVLLLVAKIPSLEVGEQRGHGLQRQSKANPTKK